MKIRYDKEADVVYIRLSDQEVAESDQEKDGVILDYSESGQIVGIEILVLPRILWVINFA